MERTRLNHAQGCLGLDEPILHLPKIVTAMNWMYPTSVIPPPPLHLPCPPSLKASKIDKQTILADAQTPPPLSLPSPPLPSPPSLPQTLRDRQTNKQTNNSSSCSNTSLPPPPKPSSDHI